MKPPFSRIGLHLDLRVQIPPAAALRRMAQEAAAHGFNTLIMEWEASFPFHQHAVVTHPLGYTPEEVVQFLEEAAALGLEVIPLQQCFGHLEYLLQHPRYAALRESENDLCQLCPCRVEEALAVFTSLFEEVMAVHESAFFHIGGDETYLLGHCPTCRAAAEAHGKSQLYVGYFARIAREVVRLGKRPVLWADMLLRYPEAAAEMPPESVFIDWNYGWAVDRFGDFNRLVSLPFERWGAVAMRSAPDNHSSYAWQTHLANFRDYLPIAEAHGFTGMMLTSWSTSGVYGYEWEWPGRPLALYPVRRVTPHAGLPVMLRAFREALKGSFDPEVFLRADAQARFGFAPEEAARFCEALAWSDPSRPENGEGTRAVKAQGLLEGLLPQRHGGEYERYRLMIDLTAFAEQVSLLEAQVHSPTLTRSTLAPLDEVARWLMAEGERLTARFNHCYEGELYPEELVAEADYRLRRIRALAAKTGGRRRRVAPAASADCLSFSP